MRRWCACVVLAVAVLAGCHSGQNQALQSDGDQAFQAYKLRGKVVRTDAAKGEITVNHEAIPGFMDAMTMPYKLRDASILGEFHPGDLITADVLVPKDPNGTTVLDHLVIVAQGRPDYRPTVAYHVPAPGDAVPDFKMRNEDGRMIHLSQFHGDVLLVTFIYTRCPLPDFCPRVTRNFAEMNARLAKNPTVYGKTHLLCVSFDPEHDTPERLRAYGATYIGSDAKSAFAHWDFAVPQQPVLDEMARFFDVGIRNEADETITHTLSTTLIGPDGKVVAFYPGNEWTVDQVVGDVEHLVGAKS